MNDAKYIGLDVHQATISVAVLDSTGKLVMEAILETQAENILQFLRGVRGSLHVVFEEGTWAAWLHDLLKPYVTRVVVCDPRKTGLGKSRNKNDRNDARELAELLYRNKLDPVYHGEHGLRALREVARSYLAITRDLTRVMSRVKAIYRSWGPICSLGCSSVVSAERISALFRGDGEGEVTCSTVVRRTRFADGVCAPTAFGFIGMRLR